MAERVVTAEVRGVGKSEARRLRREGFVPAVLYGRGVPELALKVDQKELSRVLQSTGGRSVLLTLQVKGEDGGPRTVMLKDMQRHPLRAVPLHCDFYQVSLTERVHVPVSVILVGEDVVEKTGGIVQHQMREVMVECLPGDIPEPFVLDVSGLEVGHHIPVSQLVSPPGVKVISPADDVVVTVLAPRAEEVPEVPKEAEAAPAAAEGAAAPGAAPAPETAAGAAEKPEKPEKPERAERAEKPEKRSRPEK